ncbi:hypothetical protein GCM10007079_47910 [Nocardiopsis terrae]|nr:hypothetical protein GCM10007079_47910 [Nocardiopsis terrae]
MSGFTQMGHRKTRPKREITPSVFRTNEKGTGAFHGRAAAGTGTAARPAPARTGLRDQADPQGRTGPQGPAPAQGDSAARRRPSDTRQKS